MCDQCERYTKWDKFELDFEPKQYRDCDIDVKIDYCSVYESNVRAMYHLVFYPTHVGRFALSLVVGETWFWYVLSYLFLYHIID